MDWLIGLGILILFVFMGIFLGARANKKLGQNINKGINFDKTDFKGQLSKNTPYMSAKEMIVYDTFAAILPKEYVIFPRIGIEKLLKPKAGLVLFNAVKEKFVDLTVFKRSNMEPVVVVDIYDTSIAERSFQEFDKVLTKALTAAGLPVMKVEIQSTYDKNQLLAAFLDKLNPVALAELRKGVAPDDKKKSAVSK